MVIYIRSDAQGFSDRKWQSVIEAQGSCLGSFVRDPAVPRHLSGVDPLPLQPGDCCPPPWDHQQAVRVCRSALLSSNEMERLFN